MAVEFSRDDSIRFGWNSEARSHRDNLTRALDEVERQLNAAKATLATRGEANTHALRQLAIDAAEALQHGSGLAALRRLEFALPDDNQWRAAGPGVDRKLCDRQVDYLLDTGATLAGDAPSHGPPQTR